MVKTIKRKINQLPTVTVYQSRTYQSRIGSKHTRQCSLSSRHNSVKREVEVLFLAQRKRVRLQPVDPEA
jgi:hypothetical protein